MSLGVTISDCAIDDHCSVEGKGGSHVCKANKSASARENKPLSHQRGLVEPPLALPQSIGRG
jgi:hypothetical protein